MILQAIGFITIGIVAVWMLVILVIGLWALFRPLPKPRPKVMVADRSVLRRVK